MAPLTRRHCSPSVVRLGMKYSQPFLLIHLKDNHSVSQVIERHNQHPQTPEKPEPPSLELQLENSTCAALSKELAQQTQRLRQMKGEELQVLKIEELTELEELLEAGLCRVVEEKAERIRTEISDLQRKGDLLQEENERLRKEGHSSESITNNICSLSDPNQGHHNSDTSLKLGLKGMEKQEEWRPERNEE